MSSKFYCRPLWAEMSLGNRLLMFIAVALAGCSSAVQQEPATGTPSASQSTAIPSSKPARPPAANTSSTASLVRPPATAEASSPRITAGAAAEQPAAAIADEASRSPATVAEAAEALDLASFPLLSDAQPPSARVVASLAYEAPADIKTAFEFQRGQLLGRQWKELSAPQIYDQSASGEFGRDGFHVSVSVARAGEPGKVAVRLQNHGNVNLGKLPVPAGAKLQYAFPGVASFITDAGAEETAAAVKKLLLNEGWQPYGTAGDSLHFKQHAVELNARILAPPAQPGKTVIDYSATQMSADLPAPPAAISVHYADQNKRLDVDMPGSPDEAAAYYKAALAPAGWEATTSGPVKDGVTALLIFRNPAQDMLTLNLRDLAEEKQTRLSLEHQSAAEVEALDRRVKLALDERRKKEAAERNKPKPKIMFALPAAAQDIQIAPRQIEFQLPSGGAQAALDDLKRQLTALKWQADAPVGEAAAGQLSFKSGEQSVSILYVDPGLIPATITISGSGVELERKPAGK